jgi:3-oxoacyl-[acyl-carrier protein] reductase
VPGPLKVVMTGGTGRLGRALVAALTSRGARVASTVRQGSTEGLPATFRTVDLQQADAVGPALEALADELGGVDVFLHAAGLAEGEWDPLFAVNVRAAWLAVRALQPRLAGGNVVLLGSVGAVKAMESPVVHTASHGALAALARALGKELGGQNTRVNLLALGPLTEGASRALAPELLAEYSKHACLRRQATPAEAAQAIAAFALTNTYVTGQVVVLDGGL